MTKIKIRRGQVSGQLSRIQFHDRFAQSFKDPLFASEQAALAGVEDVAWNAYKDSRKSPVTEKAGKGYADPGYDLSVEWAGTRARLKSADAKRKKAATRSRVLLIIGSARNDGSCPGENSKTYRLTRIAQKIFEDARFDVDTLDLSLLTSEYGRRIYPCKACVSTAMPLCHWPCSCYPNHSLGQTGDWMAEIYERWTAAHGVVILTPVYWYQVPSTLKLMIDRLVCADGGNPDPTSTSGKNVAKAKALELKGWPYPKHLAGRVYGLVVHGDVAGIEGVRRSLTDWLDWMGLIDAGAKARLDRFIGYYEPYATSHDTLDRDKDVQEEVRNVARAVVAAIRESRAGKLSAPDARLESPRPK
jgi:multimeric flavodoxin WrbA